MTLPIPPRLHLDLFNPISLLTSTGVASSFAAVPLSQTAKQRTRSDLNLGRTCVPNRQATGDTAARFRAGAVNFRQRFCRTVAC